MHERMPAGEGSHGGHDDYEDQRRSRVVLLCLRRGVGHSPDALANQVRLN